jgi:hypothetical protein
MYQLAIVPSSQRGKEDYSTMRNDNEGEGVKKC